MKTDWSQQHPHTLGRLAELHPPAASFKQPSSLTAERRRHLNQRAAQVSGRAVPPESGLLPRDFKKNEEPVYVTLGETVPTPPLSALVYHRDGEVSEAHMAGEEEEKEEEEGKMRWRKTDRVGEQTGY